MRPAKESEDPMLFRFSRWVAESLGLYFPPDRYADLRHGLSLACSEFGFSEPEPCMEVLMERPLTREKGEILASHLTVGETYFFREKKLFQALETVVLPELIQQRADSRTLRIWSAGCATGEEPYSIAILLHQLLKNRTDWQILVLATDINARALKKAVAAVYGEWSFRDTPAWIKNTCFTRNAAGFYQLLPEIRQMVSFSYLNLAEDVYPSLVNNTAAMDLILCRNVLMYFVPATARKVLHKLCLAIVNGGWLSLSPCDAFELKDLNFSPARIPGLTLFRKRVPQASIAAAAAPAVQAQESLPLLLSLRADETAAVGKPAGAAHPSPRAVLEQATHLLKQGSYTQAAELASSVLQINSSDAAALELLARCYANQGKLAEALQWCERALETNKLNSRLHFLRGTILQEQGRLDLAIEALKRALYLEPNFILAHFGLGNLYRQRGKAAQAQAHFDRARALLELYPPEHLLPESEGITAARLRQIIRSIRQTELAA